MPTPAATTASVSATVSTRPRTGARGSGPGVRRVASSHRSGAGTSSTRLSPRRRSVIVHLEDRAKLDPSATEVDGKGGSGRPEDHRRLPQGVARVVVQHDGSP